MIICAIPTSEDNDPVAAEAERAGAIVVRGPEHDVLARYVKAAEHVEADYVMRITSDCPLICPELCKDVLSLLISSGADYASNIEPRTFPQGLDCEAFTIETLRRADVHSVNASEREHVTTWMRKSPDVRRVNVANRWKIEGRMTLDTPADYEVIKMAVQNAL